MPPRVTTRDSYAAERSAPKQQSPFRSCNPSRRYIAALTMTHKRRDEIKALEKALARATDVKVQKQLSQRLLATKNNLRSWEDYLSEGWHRESKAVIIP